MPCATSCEHPIALLPIRRRGNEVRMQPMGDNEADPDRADAFAGLDPRHLNQGIA